MQNSIGKILLYESLGLNHLINERRRIGVADKAAKRLGKLAAKQIAQTGRGGSVERATRRGSLQSSSVRGLGGGVNQNIIRGQKFGELRHQTTGRGAYFIDRRRG